MRFPFPLTLFPDPTLMTENSTPEGRKDCMGESDGVIGEEVSMAVDGESVIASLETVTVWIGTS